MALLLVTPSGGVAFANLAVRRLLGEGRKLDGRLIDEIVAGAPAGLRDALATERDMLLTMVVEGQEESVHLSQREIHMQGLPHRLIPLKTMTRELARQEVASWKRVIRVISHELNNSLAPISSLAHSGAELARRGDRLATVFSGIGERAAHLHRFLDGYARFAKLPAPRFESVPWAAFVQSLQAHAAFRTESALPDRPACFDACRTGGGLKARLWLPMDPAVDVNARRSGGDGT